ncbi:MAG: DUF3806 domain-containing protein, partial [Pseudomonadota bacterium]
MSILNRHFLLMLCLSAMGFLSAPSFAGADIQPLNSKDKQWINAQKSVINGLSKQHLGKTLNGARSHDLPLLQALLDKKVVTKKQPKQLKAMGVMLGEIYAKEMGMDWVAYKDAKGRSLAMRWMDSSKLIFPVTKLSRMAQAGMKVDVSKVCNNDIKSLYVIIKETN